MNRAFRPGLCPSMGEITGMLRVWEGRGEQSIDKILKEAIFVGCGADGDAVSG